jgi:hypothetical protein
VANDLTALVTRVQANVDRTFTTTSFVTTAQAEQWVNDGLARIHYKIANSGEDYLLTAASSVPFVAGTSAYNLPTGFYKAKGVDYVGSDGLRYSLHRYMAAERNRREGAPSTGIGYEYRILSSTINFIPTPGSGSYILNYIPVYTVLTSAALWSTVIPIGMEDYAVAYASAQCMMKEESDPSPWVARANELWEMITDWLEPRDQLEPLRVTDVHRRWEHNIWQQWRGFR